MKVIKQSNWKNIIVGANLFGTGGGGTIEGAKNILNKINKPVYIKKLNEMLDSQLVCTVFGVGGKQNCDPILASQIALRKFQKILNKKIFAIIPVENGPMAIANAMFIASELEIPVLDSDIVGMRSSPEVYLETISILNLKRTPCVISDGKNIKTIIKNLSLENLEKKFREFAIKSGGDAIVVGYPLLIKDIKEKLPKKTISESQRNGKLLGKLKENKISISEFCKKTNWEVLDRGKIIEINYSTTKGFTIGNYKIISNRNIYKIIFKNENIILIKNNKVIITCPDLISLLDCDKLDAINNFNKNTINNVYILAKKSLPIWRSKKGKNLFSPKNLGYNYKQKLL